MTLLQLLSSEQNFIKLDPASVVYLSIIEDRLMLLLPVWIQHVRGTRWRPVLRKHRMTDNPDDFQRENKIDGQRLKEMKSFKYHEAVICYKDPSPRYFPRLPRQRPFSPD